MFNAKFASLVVAGFLMGAGAAQAFPGSADEAGVRLPVHATYAEMHRGMAGATVTTFPVGTDEAGVRLPVRSSIVGMPGSTGSAFPGSVDDAGMRLQSHSTHVDRRRSGI